MLKKTITYVDYNGVERKEDHWFNLSKAELMELEIGTTGGFTNTMERIIAAQDQATLSKIFKDFILKAYGVKSIDGRKFMKKDENGRPFADDFVETEAYSELYMELFQDEKAAAEFFMGIIPADLASKVAEQNVLPASN